MKRTSIRFIPIHASVPVWAVLAPRAKWLPYPMRHRRASFFYLARYALWSGLRALKLPEGSRVLMPSYHHGIEVEVVRASGLTVDFFRVDDQMRIDLEDIEKKIALGARAVYVTHYPGVPQPLDQVEALCRRHEVYLIEDCALSFFGRSGERPLGSSGDFSIFSLHKNLPVPDGGLLLMNRSDRSAPKLSTAAPRLAPLAGLVHAGLNRAALRRPILGGMIRKAGYEVGHQSSRLLSRFNRRQFPVGTQEFDPTSVGQGISVLSKRILGRLNFRDIYAARRRNFEFLACHLESLVEIVPSRLSEGACPVYFPIRVANKGRVRTDLCALGVETVDFWGTGHPCMPPGVFADTERMRRVTIGIPVHEDLDIEAMEYIVSAIRRSRSVR